MTLDGEKIRRILQPADADFLAIQQSGPDGMLAEINDVVRRAVSDPRALDPLLIASSPKRVDLSSSDRIIAMVAWIRNATSEWEVRSVPNWWVLARFGGDGRATLVSPFRRDHLTAAGGGSRIGPPPNGTGAGSTHVGLRLVDVNAPARIPRDAVVPGRVYITAFQYDLRSETVVTLIEGESAPAIRAPEIPDYVTYQRDARSELVGFVSVPEPVGDASAPVVSIAVQVDESAVILRSGSGSPTLMAGLILAERDHELGFVSTPVPVEEVRGPDGRPRYNAVYQVELRAVDFRRRYKIEPGEHRIYVDHGGTIAGPWPLTLRGRLW